MPVLLRLAFRTASSFVADEDSWTRGGRPENDVENPEEKTEEEEEAFAAPTGLSSRMATTVALNQQRPGSQKGQRGGLPSSPPPQNAETTEPGRQG